MSKGIVAIITLLLIAGVAYFATSYGKHNAQLVSAQELQDALNRQILTIIPQDDGLRIDGSFTCDERLTCKAQKIAILDTASESEFIVLQNLVLHYHITQKTNNTTISGEVNYGQSLLEQIEFNDPGIIEALTPLLPNKFSCNANSTLDSEEGIETNWGDCIISSPSADWQIAGNMDIGLDMFKNTTMPEMLLDLSIIPISETTLLVMKS
ncbi:MAG: hypothetical protein K2O85_05310, partial [Helicobacter sp.]|nr:hypothetical protein [Helicobacter sp.]